MRIVAHDEDSMTNLFFSEVHRHEKLEDFLALIAWRSAAHMPFDVAAAELHQQVNFSEFGRPDVIILVTDSNGRKHIVIVEVKLGKYLESSVATVTGKFEKRPGFNSQLNAQLALKYRAMISLPSILEQGFMTESGHPSESPYCDDQVRRCKKRETIDFFADLARTGFEFYLVTLTSDGVPPLDAHRLASSDPCFPLFFDQCAKTQTEYSNLGSVLWSQCMGLFDGVDSHLSESFGLHFVKALEAEESAEAPLRSDLFVRGRQIVRFAGKTCHLACKGYSFTVRDFRNGDFVAIYAGKNDREKYLGLRTQIQVLRRAPQEPLADKSFWARFFQALNEGSEPLASSATIPSKEEPVKRAFVAHRTRADRISRAIGRHTFTLKQSEQVHGEFTCVCGGRGKHAYIVVDEDGHEIKVGTRCLQHMGIDVP
jgi:hypothetical protein